MLLLTMVTLCSFVASTLWAQIVTLWHTIDCILGILRLDKTARLLLLLFCNTLVKLS